jgi:hypothetical protein
MLNIDLMCCVLHTGVLHNGVLHTGVLSEMFYVTVWNPADFFFSSVGGIRYCNGRIM